MEKTVRINFENEVDSSKLHNAIFDALSKRIGEVYVIVKKSDKQHFCSVDLTQVYDLLSKSAEAHAEEINKQIEHKN